MDQVPTQLRQNYFFGEMVFSPTQQQFSYAVKEGTREIDEVDERGDDRGGESDN